MSDWLFTAAGGDYLRREYAGGGRSTYDIAGERGTYPNLVRRALEHHGIPRRGRGEAQKKALESGRGGHPTKGTRRGRATRERIGESLGRAWASLTPEQRESRRRLARRAWLAMTPAQLQALYGLAVRALHRAVAGGSKVERFLAEGLAAAGHVVLRRTAADLLLPRRRVAVRVDGPAHFFPIWGRERLAKTQAADGDANESLLRAGYAVVRVKCVAEHVSGVALRRLLGELKGVLAGDPEGIIELEVK